jgi:hypothetical protein
MQGASARVSVRTCEAAHTVGRHGCEHVHAVREAGHAVCGRG